MGKYTTSFFSQSMPDWKKKKDPIICRFIYRPISFWVASVCANMGISANTVSYFSLFLGFAGCVCYLIPSFSMHMVGAIICNIWLLLDCVDGNIARSVKKQLFGEFADAISSYIFAGLLYTAIGFTVYFDGGILVKSGCVWMILVGAVASASDTLMRLIHQKYINTEREHIDNGVLPRSEVSAPNHEQSSLKDHLFEALGLGGWLPLVILIATYYNALDLVLFYCLAYFGGPCLIMSYKYIHKAIEKANLYSIDK